jgi:hypothetical protein
MATSIKLKSDIKKIEAAIKSKATPKSLVPKLQSKLDKIKDELASLSSAKPKKGVTKTKVLSSLQKLKAKVKTTKSLSGYKKSGIDLKKDADVPALPLGKRYSQNTGNPYYEYRLNRADVKQPPKRYPKLEDGGMMDEKSEYASGGRIKSAVNRDRAYKSDEAWEQSYKRKSRPKNPKYDTSDKGIFEKGGYMAEGGETEEILYKVVGKKNGQLVDITELPMTKDDANRFIKEQGIDNYYQNVDIVIYRGSKPRFKYAMGGALEHGLKVGDVVKLVSGNSIAIYNTKDKNSYRVNISEGKREMVSDIDFNKYAQGGELHRLEQGM